MQCSLPFCLSYLNVTRFDKFPLTKAVVTSFLTMPLIDRTFAPRQPVTPGFNTTLKRRSKTAVCGVNVNDSFQSGNYNCPTMGFRIIDINDLLLCLSEDHGDTRLDLQDGVRQMLTSHTQNDALRQHAGNTEKRSCHIPWFLNAAFSSDRCVFGELA